MGHICRYLSTINATEEDVATHYYKPGAMKYACNAAGSRSVGRPCTSDRAVFEEMRKAGTACERCAASLDKKDAIAAKYSARASKQ